MTITVKYGGSSSTLDNVPNGSNLACIQNNRQIAMHLGYGENVSFLVNGVSASADTILNNGDVITVTQRHHEKA